MTGMTKMQASKTTTVLAKVLITLAAAALLLFLRPDLAALAAEKYNAVSTPHLVAEYLRTHDVRKLQIGAGPSNLDGWLNTDIAPSRGQGYLDATETFPFPDQSFQYVFSEHLIEHLPYEGGQLMLRESYRVLAPGGRIRVATPDLTKFVELFQEEQPESMRSYQDHKLVWHRWPETADPACFILSMQLREWGHQFVYSPKMIRASLESAGFSQIQQFAVNESDDPALRGIEHVPPGDLHSAKHYESMVWEAVRE